MKTIKQLLQKRLKRLKKLRDRLLGIKILTDNQEFELTDIQTEIPYVECQIELTS